MTAARKLADAIVEIANKFSMDIVVFSNEDGMLTSIGVVERSVSIDDLLRSEVEIMTKGEENNNDQLN